MKPAVCRTWKCVLCSHVFFPFSAPADCPILIGRLPEQTAAGASVAPEGFLAVQVAHHVPLHSLQTLTLQTF